MDGTKIAAAWKEWLDSEEGQKASDPTTIGAPLTFRRYLESRLERAFQAGVRFGANAIADEVIAVMGKEKSL